MKPPRKSAKMRRRRLEFADAFAVVLEKHRTAKKLSPQSLAEKAGVHQTYVGIIERGLSNPSLNAANAMANALQVPFSTLIAQAESLRARAEVHRRRMSVEEPKSRKRNQTGCICPPLRQQAGTDTSKASHPTCRTGKCPGHCLNAKKPAWLSRESAFPCPHRFQTSIASRENKPSTEAAPGHNGILLARGRSFIAFRRSTVLDRERFV